MGTTRHGENHTYTLEGVEGTVFLTDTPGLSEIGDGGAEREREARELAARADLLDLRARPRPDPHRVRAAGGPGPPGEALDRRPQQDRPVHRRRPRRHPGQAPRTPPRARAGRRRRRRRGRAPADRRSASSGADGSTETVLEEQPPELDGAPGPDRPDPQARGRDASAPATCCSAPICSAARPRISSPRSATSGPRT